MQHHVYWQAVEVRHGTLHMLLPVIDLWCQSLSYEKL